jgi:hypothetical protein
MPINYEALKLETIPRLDKKIAVLFDRQMQRICDDCCDRPTDKTARRLTVEFIVEPILDPDNLQCDTVRLTVEAKAKIPVYRTPVYQCLVTNKGLKFNTDTPEAVDQQPLFDEREDAPDE